MRVHYPALDGIRGLAILLVVLYHNFSFIKYTSFGWLGVDLFFVLSGYLITGVLIATQGQKRYLSTFYMKRILRIFPLYYSVLCLLLYLLPRLFQNGGLFAYSLNHQVWLWTFTQNWLYIFTQPDAPGLLNHFWSLAVEEQFYLFWPFIILWLRRPKYLLVFLVLMLVALFTIRLFLWLQQIEDLPYYNIFTFSRVDGICIGSMIALLQAASPHFLTRNTTWIVIGLALLNLLFDFVNGLYQYSFPYLALVGFTTFPFMFGLLIHEATRGSATWVKHIFSIPLLRFLGKISFGLYIFHWPLYVLLKPGIIKWISEMGIGYEELLCSCVITLMAVLISTISFYFFEMKFLTMKEKLA